MTSNAEYQRRRRAEKREEVLAADRARNQTPKRKAWKRAQYQKKREAILAQRKAKYQGNRESVLEKNRAWREKNPRAIRGRLLERTYGITLEQFEQMRAAQDGKCAVCREPFTKVPHVDHDHSTGAVRDLLCGGCNVGLGRFQDNPERMEAAAAYIRKHKAVKLTLVKEA